MWAAILPLKNLKKIGRRCLLFCSMCSVVLPWKSVRESSFCMVSLYGRRCVPRFCVDVCQQNKSCIYSSSRYLLDSLKMNRCKILRSIDSKRRKWGIEIRKNLLVSLRLRWYEFVAFAVDVDNFYVLVGLEVFSEFGDVYIHRTSVEVIIVYPNGL